MEDYYYRMILIEENGFKKPEKWGDDTLSAYIENFHLNSFATFANLKESHVRAFTLVDKYKTFSVKWLDHPKDKLYQAQLFIKCYFSINTALILAYSGSLPEAYNIIRLPIEASLYALAMTENADLKKIWIERNQSEEKKSLCRNKYKIGLFFDLLTEKNKNLSFQAKKFYDHSIDMGAHPNQASVIDRLYIQENGPNENPSLMQIGLTANSKEIEHTLDFLINAGDVIFQIFRYSFPERYTLAGH